MQAARPVPFSYSKNSKAIIYCAGAAWAFAITKMLNMLAIAIPVSLPHGQAAHIDTSKRQARV